MNAEERIEKVQETLQRRFRAAGHGSITRVQKALDLGAGYFKDQRRPDRRRVDLRVLLRALEVLGVAPADFFAEALGPADVVDGLRSEAATLERRLKRLPRILERVDEEWSGRSKTGKAERRSETEETAELAELEKLRFENPNRVIRRAPGVLRRLGKARMPVLLGICASAYRALGRTDQALVTLARALRDAETLGDLATVADLLQRASYLVADGGGYERALALSERATLTYVRTTDLIGIGKTLVDQGIWLDYMGRRQRAIRAYESALEKYLPAGHQRGDVRRNRFSALMNLGALHLRLGELQRARGYADAARAESDGVGASLRAKLIWLQASIAGRQGLLDEAEGFLREVVEVSRPISPIEAALASVELVRILFQRGEPREAYATAKTMTVLLQPLEGHPIAVAALTELLRCALAGRGLTLDLLERTARGIEKEGRAPRRRGAHPR